MDRIVHYINMHQMANGSCEELARIPDFYKFCSEIVINSPVCNDGPSGLSVAQISQVEPCGLVSGLDDHLSQMIKAGTPKSKSRRGRKLLRPKDPLIVKSEIKDKFWLRKFRIFMKNKWDDLKPSFTPEEKTFWNEYLSKEGKPEQGRKFLSYSKRYKNYLFNNPSFYSFFRNWFYDHGASLLEKKYPPHSDMWTVYYNYVVEVLLPLNQQEGNIANN